LTERILALAEYLLSMRRIQRISNWRIKHL
jgi:hypothetical protein